MRLLFVGRLSPRKGPDVAARAVRALEDRGVGAVLDVVGDVFPGYEWFEQALAEEFGDLVASGRLRLRGFAADVWPHVEAADVVLVPATLPESLGNTAIEAILAARPVVVSDAGGLSEVAAGCPTARIVPPGDAEAIADAVTSLLDRWTEVRAAAPARRSEAATSLRPGGLPAGRHAPSSTPAASTRSRRATDRTGPPPALRVRSDGRFAPRSRRPPPTGRGGCSRRASGGPPR